MLIHVLGQRMRSDGWVGSSVSNYTIRSSADGWAGDVEPL